jgi:dipeptidyl aminopeptidase/acylaminoacyl peptidase
MTSETKRLVIISLVLVSDLITPILSRGDPRPFTVADDIELSYFGDPYDTAGVSELAPSTFSPNGEYFVVDTERGRLDINRSESTLRLYKTEDVRRFLRNTDSRYEPVPDWTFSESTYKDGPIITHIRWLANSSGIAFLAKTASGNNQLVIADIATKSLQMLTSTDEHVTAFDIVDRKHFVYTILSPAIRQGGIAESLAVSIVGTGRDLSDLMFPTDSTLMRNHDLSELWAVLDGKRFRINDKFSGQPIPIHEAGEWLLALSPDGNSVVTALAISRVPAQWETLYRPPSASSALKIRAGLQNVRAADGSWNFVSEDVVIDLRNANVRSLTNAPSGLAAGWWGAYTRADWSKDGSSVVLPNTFVTSEARSGTGKKEPCVAVVNLEKGMTTCLERLEGQAADGDTDFRFILGAHFIEKHENRVEVNYMLLKGKDSYPRGTTTYIRRGDNSWVRESPVDSLPQDAPISVSVKQGINEPPVLVANERATHRSRVILDPNPQFKSIDLGIASVFTWRDAKDREWIGGLYKPPDFVLGRRYPLVLQTHGFVKDEFRPAGMFPTAFAARELAAAGFIVLQVQECNIVGNPEEGRCNVAVDESAVKELVADGLVDPNRIGIIGFSRSCYWVLEALTTSSLKFQAASITDGVNQGYLQYMTTVDRQGGQIAREADGIVGAAPFGEGLQEWLKLSPDFNMHKVSAPLQLVAKGRAMGLLKMWEPYAALRYLNRPVDLILLEEGTHVLTNPAQRMISQGGTVEWMRFWLQGYEDPSPTKADQYARWRKLRELQDEHHVSQSSE